MQDIQERAIKSYEKNMHYFETNYPALHNKLLALDTLLNNQTIPQRYDLEYKDGYFDVIELESGALLYQQDSEQFSQKICDEISYKKSEHTFKSYRKTNYDKEAVEFIKKQNAYTQFNATAEIHEYYYRHTDDSMSMTQIEKFIFLGVGLGLHIPKIMKRFDVQIPLVIEDSVELFRLSLFTTDYAEAFSNATPFFSIAENKNEFHTKFNDFFQKAFFKNQYIKFSMFSSIYEDRIQEIRSLLITRPEATYSHERLLVKNHRVLDKIKKEYKFLNLEKKSEDTFFQEKPWLVLGAGPSLYDNAEWLLENHSKFIIIAAFTALNTLKRIGVRPDIAVQIDENDFTTSEMIEKLEDFSFLDKTLIFFSASVSKLLFDKFDKERVYLHEDRTKYKLSASTLVVASVGETIYTLALLYNASNIYILGIDLALGDDGESHTPDHFKATTIKNSPTQSNSHNGVDDFQLSGVTMRVKGNLRESVETTPLFALSIPVINYKTRHHKSPQQSIYNLSDGAFFDDMIPSRPESVPITKELDKESSFEELKAFFDGYSSRELQGKELDGIKCREAQIKDYYAILEIFKNSSHANKEIFLSSFVKLVHSITNHNCMFELHELLTVYFLRVAAHVDDFIYTKEINSSKKHLKKFKQFFLVNVEKIIKTYEDDLKKLSDNSTKEE